MAGLKEEGRVVQGSPGSNDRDCESVDTRLDCMTFVASAVDLRNYKLRSQLWENTGPVGTSNYLGWTGLTGVHDAAGSAQIGWKLQGRVEFGNV